MNANDPLLEALWKNVVDHWDDEAAHRKFIEHCAESDKLVEAAVRYRGMAGDAARGEQANKRLAGISVLAMAKLEGMRTHDKPAPRHTAAYLLIAVFVMATLGLLAYLQSSAP